MQCTPTQWRRHAAAELLNLNSVFVVVDCVRKRGFVWVGRWANEHKKKHRKALARTRISTLAWSLWV